jgi:outer membrane receptor protein involved in Fe transport
MIIVCYPNIKNPHLMKKLFPEISLTIIVILLSLGIHAQTNTIISGNVKNSLNNENIPSVSIIIKGSSAGTYTDNKGNFKISGSYPFPVTLVFSSIGFASKEVAVENISNNITVALDPVSALAQEVVVSASRLPQRILESPVSIERVSAAAIRNAAAPSYYDLLANLKGVDIVASSLNFKTPSTRGFNSSGNLRLNQLVEGMDNQSPGLNFAVGSMAGLTELDVENMELLSGASSALYGPGGMNGTLLINSKDPFKYQGLSAQVKQGVMHITDSAADASPYYDFSFRWGQKVSEKFAFKIAGQFIQAKDWVASDYSNYDIGNNPASGKIKPGNRQTDPNYQGVNVYGDETSADIRPVLQAALTQNPALAPIINPLLASPQMVSRTGYKENEVLDPTTKNIRLSGGVYYKITPAIEASLSGNFGTGSTVYTGSDRYSLKDFKLAQFKFELKHKNWFLRTYTTREDAGKSFNATVTTRLFNEAWKPSYNPADPLGSWYPQYTVAYLQALAIGADNISAHNAARAFADLGRPAPRSPEFRQKFDSVGSRSISNGGGLFVDKSSLYMTEGQYNFTDIVKVAEVLVGANFKQYVLNSGGTIFDDLDKRIRINETGAYALISKAFFKDVLKLTAAGRYDKNENFKGRFTPRFSAVITVAKNNNIRLSYQTAYRFPSTQNQFIDLEVQNGARLIGGLPRLREKYNIFKNPLYTPESVQAFGASAQTGQPNPALLQQVTFGEYRPESATSGEIGYKALISGKLLVDAYAYYSQYQNFLGRIIGLQSSDGTPAGFQNPHIFSVAVNSTGKVNTHGWGISGEYLLPNNFSINANVYSDEITNVPANFVAQFNTPKYRGNIGISNTGFLRAKRAGFTIQYKYQGKVYYQGDFGAGNIPAFQTIDAQVNYKFPRIRSMIKLGGTNITNHYYRTAFANPNIGALYYVSFAYNVF